MIFLPLVVEGYEWINCVSDNDYEIFLSFNGSRRSKVWKPVRVRRVRADDRQQFNPSDFPWLGAHALVLRRKAVDALSDIFDAHGEVLPLVTEDNVELFVFNARAVDALDEARSTVVMFPGTKRIMHIEKIAFVESTIRDLDIFRLPHRASATYVSRRLVERVMGAGLVGLGFNQVWSPDQGPFS